MAACPPYQVYVLCLDVTVHTSVTTAMRAMCRASHRDGCDVTG
jgi:hypothetical protein